MKVCEITGSEGAEAQRREYFRDRTMRQWEHLTVTDGNATRRDHSPHAVQSDSSSKQVSRTTSSFLVRFVCLFDEPPQIPPQLYVIFMITTFAQSVAMQLIALCT